MDVNGLQAQGNLIYASCSPESSGLARLLHPSVFCLVSDSPAAKSISSGTSLSFAGPVMTRHRRLAPIHCDVFPHYAQAPGSSRQLPHLDSISASLMRPLNGPRFVDRFFQCPR